MGEYFTTRVTGSDKVEVERRVAELVAKGFEVVVAGEESYTAVRYRRTNGVGRSKYSFEEREERGKFIVQLRRRNVERWGLVQ